MKITVKELKTLIREQVEEAKVSMDAEAELRAFVDKLQDLLDRGEAHTISISDFSAAEKSVGRLRAKAAAASRSPEDRRASAQKGAASRKANAALDAERSARFRASQDALKKSIQDRMDDGLLPLKISGMGSPSRKYYAKSDGDMDIYGMSAPTWELRPEHEDTVVSPEERERILGGTRAIG